MEYVWEHMDFPALRWFMKYWKKNPPVHLSVAAYLGIGKDDVPKQLNDSASAILDDLLPSES